MITVALATDILPNPSDFTGQEFIIDGVATLSGSFAAHGDTFDYSQLGIPSDVLANRIEIYEATPASGKPAYGAAFLFLPGTTQANGVMEIFNGTTEVTVSAATYASLSLPAAFKLRWRGWFPRGL